MNQSMVQHRNYLIFETSLWCNKEISVFGKSLCCSKVITIRLVPGKARILLYLELVYGAARKVPYLEPVYGAAVDEGGKHAESVTECVPDGTHGKHNVQVVLHALHKVVVHRQRRRVHLLALIKNNIIISGSLRWQGIAGSIVRYAGYRAYCVATLCKSSPGPRPGTRLQLNRLKHFTVSGKGQGQGQEEGGGRVAQGHYLGTQWGVNR